MEASAPSTSTGLLLAMLGHHAMRRLRDAHIANGLSPRQFHLLTLLDEHGSIGQRELGQTMDIDPSIVVTMLNPLEHDGLVRRVRDPQDRRRHVVTLTTAGEERLQAAARAQRDVEEALFAGLDGAQRELLQQLLVQLNETFVAEQCGAPCLGAAATCDSDADHRDLAGPATMCD